MTMTIHETEIKPSESKWSGPGPPEGQHSGHALYHLADHLIGDYHMDFEG